MELVDVSRSNVKWVEGPNGWAKIQVVLVGEVRTCEVCEGPMPGATGKKLTCSDTCRSIKRYIKAGKMAPRGRVKADV